MSVILEGIDGIGKTTFALDYCQLYPKTIYIHNWAKPKNDIDIESEMSKEILLLQHSNIIFDRSFVISEYVYANVLNRPTIITYEHIKSFIDTINIYNHTVELFVVKHLSVLNVKEEDKWLPLAELQTFYSSLFQALMPDNFIIRDVEEGVIYASY